MKTITGTNVNTAIGFLKKGEIIALPTETVYGLACHAFSEKSVRKIYELKGRTFKKPLTLQFCDFSKLSPFVLEIPDIYMKIAGKYCPGPITFVFKKSAAVPDYVTSGLPTIGIRIPGHPVALKLLGSVDFPVAVTSANPSGMTDSLSAESVMGYFRNKIPYVLEGNSSMSGMPSTVIEFRNGKLNILREGAITPDQLLSL